MKIDELQLLVTAWLDGRMTEAESLTLQEELRTNPIARAEFHRWTKLDAAIREQAERMTSAEATCTSVLARPVREWFSLKSAGWIATAASILFAVALWSRSPLQSKTLEPTSSGCAMLSQVFDANFENTAVRSGDTLMPGVIKLSKGLAQIEFFSGATVLVEGAAEIEIVSAWEARCVSGRVRVHVPSAAKGFLMHAPGMTLEDLGTEFGLNVDSKMQSSEVHVFDGEVIAHPNANEQTSLTQGMGLARDAMGKTVAVSTPQDFLSINELQTLLKERQSRRFDEWQAWSKRARTDQRLIAYYTFKHWTDDRWDRIVNNFAEPRQKQRTGGAVGARWIEGRWPGKEALEFKRPGDRVRMNIEGVYSAISMECWVKVDSVDKKYNSLLLTDGYDNGEPHWQIYEDGSLMFSIMYRPANVPKAAKYNQMYYSKPVFTSDSLGRWHHVAVTYDGETGTVIQYFDGKKVSREISTLHQPGREIVFGPCEIGNWGLPTPIHEFPIRNLNGAIDEFSIYREVLSPAEIQEHFTAGKPE